MGQDLNRLLCFLLEAIWYLRKLRSNVVAHLSMEFEYKAMAQLTCELVGIYQYHLGQFGLAIHIPYRSSVTIKPLLAIHIANNLVFHEHTKHIEVLSSSQTGDQLANLFTRVLELSWVTYICNKLDVMDIYAPL